MGFTVWVNSSIPCAIFFACLGSTGFSAADDADVIERHIHVMSEAVSVAQSERGKQVDIGLAQ